MRDALRHRADRFEMPAEVPDRVVAAVDRRKTRNGVVIGAASAGVVLLTTVSIFVAQLPRSGGSPSREVVDGGSAMSYVLLGATTSGETTAPTWLTEHVACMRAQGFDIPDPTETGNGWSIVVDDPEAIGFGTPAWREAAFVTCAIDRPLSGNLILGLPKDRVDSFVACMSGQGFDLPTPSVTDAGAYVFDLTKTDIDTGQPAWDRAAFVTCSPDATKDR